MSHSEAKCQRGGVLGAGAQGGASTGSKEEVWREGEERWRMATTLVWQKLAKMGD